MTTTSTDQVFAQNQAMQRSSQQRIEGTWQGSIEASDGVYRVVLKISVQPDGSLSAFLYSIDRSGSPIAIPAISFNGSTLTWSIPNLLFSYEGKLSAQSNSISGVFTQEKRSFPLLLTLSTPGTQWTIPEAAPKATDMASDARPGIEIATIKVSPPDARRSGLSVRGRDILVDAYTVDDMIKFAYDVQDRQLTGTSTWMHDQKFDVVMQPDISGLPNREQLQLLVQKLLADRFFLRFHEESRKMSAYVLTVAKGGPKLTRSDDKSESAGISVGPLGLVRARNATIGQFCAKMQALVLDRPLLDETKLDGRWDFSLRWLPDESQFDGQLKIPADDESVTSLPSLPVAMEEQLGFKLEAKQAMVKVLDIDHTERPSAN